MGTHQKVTMNDKNTQDAKKFIQGMEIDVLARTLWGESRSEGTEGMTAVAHVILNRVEVAKNNNGTYWWGHDVITVCQKPYQFSCWNPGDPNRKKLMTIDENDIHFATALRIARRAIFGQLGKDKTLGADHYHTAAVKPFWSKGKTPLAHIGSHLFFKLERS